MIRRHPLVAACGAGRSSNTRSASAKSRSRHL